MVVHGVGKAHESCEPCLVFIGSVQAASHLLPRLLGFNSRQR